MNLNAFKDWLIRQGVYLANQLGVEIHLGSQCRNRDEAGVPVGVHRTFAGDKPGGCALVAKNRHVLMARECAGGSVSGGGQHTRCIVAARLSVLPEHSVSFRRDNSHSTPHKFESAHAHAHPLARHTHLVEETGIDIRSLLCGQKRDSHHVQSRQRQRGGSRDIPRMITSPPVPLVVETCYFPPKLVR